MKINCRLIIDQASPATYNMAVDEAILKLGISTLRLYKWQPSAISIGYFQSLKQEVDIEKCKQNGVDIIRRITGGGAVYHDQELTYSFIIPKSANLIKDNIIESYHQICNAVIRGLIITGINAEFAPINDIIVNNKKISGSAQTRRHNGILQHGTILLNVNVDKMFDLLEVPNEKIKDKLIKNVKERVTSVKHILNKDIRFEDFTQPIVQGFKEEFNLTFQEQPLTDQEIEEAKHLEITKFSTQEWNYKR